MPLLGFDELCRHADDRPPGLIVAVAGGADRTVLKALGAARDRGWIRPLVVGVESEVRAVADRFDIDLHLFLFLNSDDEVVATAAVDAVKSGRASILMKGKVSSPTLMAAIADPEFGIRSGRVVCQVVLMEVVPHGRRFLMADTGVCVQPKLATKVDIMRSAVELAHALGEPSPRVAVMAATEVASAGMLDTMHAAELQRRNEGGEFPDCRVQGPLSFDLAYAADTADKKRVGGPVVGAADVMLFPDLTSANLTVKAIMYTADCRFGGVLGGTTAPVVFMSRADSTETRLRSLAMALIRRSNR